MTYTKITVIINSKPPYFIGSQIRGAFGYALKKVTCINPSFKCNGCFAQDNCLYYDFYEKKNTFHKYRLDFELGKEFYDFSLYLFDDITEKLPYVVSALNMMINKNGLGRDRKTFNDFDMYINDESCLDNNQIKIPKEFKKDFSIDNICTDITLKLKTPLRIKKNNKFLRDDSIELKDIINSTYQRQMKLLGRGFKSFPYEIKGEIVSKQIKYKELTRLSNRQKTTMNLGGVIGELEIKNLNKESYEVLKLAELLSIGKSTVFGNGKVEIEEF